MASFSLDHIDGIPPFSDSARPMKSQHRLKRSHSNAFVASCADKDKYLMSGALPVGEEPIDTDWTAPDHVYSIRDVANDNAINDSASNVPAGIPPDPYAANDVPASNMATVFDTFKNYVPAFVSRALGGLAGSLAYVPTRLIQKFSRPQAIRAEPVFRNDGARKKILLDAGRAHKSAKSNRSLYQPTAAPPTPVYRHSQLEHDNATETTLRTTSKSALRIPGAWPETPQATPTPVSSTGSPYTSSILSKLYPEAARRQQQSYISWADLDADAPLRKPFISKSKKQAEPSKPSRFIPKVISSKPAFVAAQEYKVARAARPARYLKSAGPLERISRNHSLLTKARIQAEQIQKSGVLHMPTPYQPLNGETSNMSHIDYPQSNGRQGFVATTTGPSRSVAGYPNEIIPYNEELSELPDADTPIPTKNVDNENLFAEPHTPLGPLKKRVHFAKVKHVTRFYESEQSVAKAVEQHYETIFSSPSVTSPKFNAPAVAQVAGGFAPADKAEPRTTDGSRSATMSASTSGNATLGNAHKDVNDVTSVANGDSRKDQSALDSLHNMGSMTSSILELLPSEAGAADLWGHSERRKAVEDELAREKRAAEEKDTATKRKAELERLEAEKALVADNAKQKKDFEIKETLAPIVQKGEADDLLPHPATPKVPIAHPTFPRIASPPTSASPIVLPLSAEWRNELDSTIEKSGYGKKRDESLAPNLTTHDFGTLLQQEFMGSTSAWLNDNIVNEFLGVIVREEHALAGWKKVTAGPAAPVFAMPSQWWLKISKDATDAKSWLRKPVWDTKAKFMQAELMLVPICDGGHWRLIAIKPQEKIIEYLDSMDGPGKTNTPSPKFFKAIRNWLAHKLESDYIEQEWATIIKRSAQQVNFKDCGVFTCINALALILDRNPGEVTVTNGMQVAREYIAGTILARKRLDL